MLRAQSEGITPEKLIARIGDDHRADFAEFHIRLRQLSQHPLGRDRELASLIYTRLRDAGHIATRTITQAYDPVKEMFLPDRFIKGECPRCGAADQYGDSCEACGATYSPTELKNACRHCPVAKPIEKESAALFLQARTVRAAMRNWTGAGHLQTEVANKLGEWFDDGLREWDISVTRPTSLRDSEAEGKYFYVWAGRADRLYGELQEPLRPHRTRLRYLLAQDSEPSCITSLARTSSIFHALFWPAMLQRHFRMPTPSTRMASSLSTSEDVEVRAAPSSWRALT